MKYKVEGRLQILINYGLFDLENVFLMYSEVYNSWIIISNHLTNDNQLVGYTVVETNNQYVSLHMLKFNITRVLETYPNEVMTVTIAKHDTNFFIKMIGKINYVVILRNLRKKHIDAINSKDKMIKF